MENDKEIDNFPVSCNNCGSTISSSDKKCNYCGASTSDTVISTKTVPKSNPSYSGVKYASIGLQIVRMIVRIVLRVRI